MTQPATQLLNVRSVYKSIETFLDYKGSDSINTKMAYEKDIRNFFSFMKGKELHELTTDDLGFIQEDVLRYRSYLAGLVKENGEPKYKAASINRFIESVRSLFDFLIGNKYREFIDQDAFSFNNLKNVKREKTGQLKENEFRLFESKALELDNGYMKSMLIGLAGRTSIRLSALLSLKWSDIKKDNGDVWLISVVDKGQEEDVKPILDVFFKKLIAMKENEEYQSALAVWRKSNFNAKEDVIFPISTTAVARMVNRIAKLLGIPDERNIRFHSFKGFGINMVRLNGGSVLDMQKQAHHKDFKTTNDFYIDQQEKDYSKYAGVIMDSEFTTDPLHDLSKDELIELINKCDIQIRRAIMNEYTANLF
ncbi:tyrosine-type recombinase/integrase [Brevibacillus sp. NRS-1366]|uniref:tyrosine-type recombinase/integrase n=1 Tax=Brevibacillus sp. NRS-1366 TaxID=3233899 RepID=UPI003D1D2178